MNWKLHKEKLENGETVQIRPRGNSMEPLISSGDLVTISPDISNVKKGDIVFCKVSGSHYIHLVTAIQEKMGGTRYQISNNKNHTNGWTMKVFGKVTKVES